MQTIETTARRRKLAACMAALLAMGLPAAVHAQAQTANNFAAQCATTSGAVQVDACLAALNYQPGNATLLRYLGDGLLTTSRPGGAFDAYGDALAANPTIDAARSGRDEAVRQINGRAPIATAPVPMATPTVLYVPVQPVVVPQATMQPVVVHPFDGAWTGAIEPRGQRFQIRATVVGGELTMRYEDSTHRMLLRGRVAADGQFAGQGFLRDKNKLYGGGDNDGDKLAVSGRFTPDRFEGTGSAGQRYTTVQLSRAGL